MLFILLFFFKQKTAYEMRISDWSSDVCSSDLMLSLLGMIGGIWSEKFDHIAAVTNFVITPFSFLSGTFYSIERLPETWQVVAHFNPFFYMIDGFRYGFIGYADGSLVLGVVVMAGFTLFLWAVT